MKKIILSEIDLINGGESYICECSSNIPSRIMLTNDQVHVFNRIINAASKSEAFIACANLCNYLGRSFVSVYPSRDIE